METIIFKTKKKNNFVKRGIFVTNDKRIQMHITLRLLDIETAMHVMDPIFFLISEPELPISHLFSLSPVWYQCLTEECSVVCLSICKFHMKKYWQDRSLANQGK